MKWAADEKDVGDVGATIHKTNYPKTVYRPSGGSTIDNQTRHTSCQNSSCENAGSVDTDPVRSILRRSSASRRLICHFSAIREPVLREFDQQSGETSTT